MNNEEESSAVEEHPLDAFDDGTVISAMSDGSVQLRFSLMPPSWPCEDAAFECLEDQLSAVLGVTVEAWDKELFAVPKPTSDTIERLKAHLLRMRRELERPTE